MNSRKNNKKTAKKKKPSCLPMHKHIATAALAVEFSALSAVALFLIATLAGQPALNFA